MSNFAPDLLSRKNTANNVGGISGLRLAYSNEIIQQRFQTDSEISPPLIFLSKIKFVTGWSGKYLQGLINIEEIISEEGFSENYNFTAYLDSFCTEQEFKSWWTKYLKGRRVAAEITDMNGMIRVINPFIVTYKYLATRDFADQNRYELIFNRARIIETQIDNLKIIEEIVPRKINYAGVLNNEVTIILYTNITISLFDFGYSPANDVDTVIYQFDPKSNILNNITDGDYYFFAINREFPALYDVMKASITDGVITVISDFDNPQIITENETLEDQGTIVSD